MATLSAQAPSAPTGRENRGAVGAYKDFQNMNVDHEKELKGTDQHKAASYPLYLPVWTNEQGKK